MPSSYVPVIDLTGSHTDETAADHAAALIGAACESSGFLVVTNVGVDPAVVDRMYDVCLRFFRLPEAAKRTATAVPVNRFRGYTAPADRPGAAGSPSDLVQSFQASRFEDAEAMRVAGYDEQEASAHLPNVWPDEPSDMAGTWHDYFEAMSAVATHVTSLMARALDLPADWFADKFDRHASFITANYYPAQEQAPLPGQLRQSAHTDFGGVTVLFQDSDIGGLQVRRPDGSWFDVPAIPGSFVINLGDLLAKWTNDRWVATEHRVVNPRSDNPVGVRVSIGLFQHPNRDAVITPIPTCVGPDNPARYPAVRAGDWAGLRMQTYTAPLPPRPPVAV